MMHAQRVPSVVAIGIFDGVHRGHQALLQKTLQHARKKSLMPCALTFSPHPAQLFAPDKAPLLIDSIEQRIENLKSHGIEKVVVMKFTPSLAAMPYQGFTRTILLDQLAAKHIVVGEDFVFGKGRLGNRETLTKLSQSLPFEVTFVSKVVDSYNQRISSTRIRSLIQQGEIEKANLLLGRALNLRFQQQDGLWLAHRPKGRVWPQKGRYPGQIKNNRIYVDIEEDKAFLQDHDELKNFTDKMIECTLGQNEALPSHF